MTDEKYEFNVKGILNELTVDNGPSSSFEAYFKSEEEREAALKQQLKRAKNSYYVGSNKA
ncbi:hypothetical protein [Pseudoalteromonas sp. bablab_jr004]|uniref:hypothetical protein n=1 Tax=Pseudoalteromonas sp. bablab_jr004 TaxID=2755065 RepID=UPI0018F6D212|nr:hypothetical protein [Pseudoalteromonas sp. bablab_jr004]